MSWDSKRDPKGHFPEIGKHDRGENLFNFNFNKRNTPHFTMVIKHAKVKYGLKVKNVEIRVIE